MTTICVVCHRSLGDSGAKEPDLCGDECREDWETSLQVEVDPDEQCGTVNGTNGAGWVYVPGGGLAVQRQEAAWRIANATGSVCVGSLAVFYPNVTKETLRKDLRALVDGGFLEAHGENKGRWYGPVGVTGWNRSGT